MLQMSQHLFSVWPWPQYSLHAGSDLMPIFCLDDIIWKYPTKYYDIQRIRIQGFYWLLVGHRPIQAYFTYHYNYVIMGVIASQITSLTIVYSIVHSDTDQRKHQSSMSLAFVLGIHRWPVNSPYKWPVTRKMFPFDDVIMDTIPPTWRTLDTGCITFHNITFYVGNIFKPIHSFHHNRHYTDMIFKCNSRWNSWQTAFVYCVSSDPFITF